MILSTLEMPRACLNSLPQAGHWTSLTPARTICYLGIKELRQQTELRAITSQWKGIIFKIRSFYPLHIVGHVTCNKGKPKSRAGTQQHMPGILTTRNNTECPKVHLGKQMRGSAIHFQGDPTDTQHLKII